jgi:hypothetical protein
LAEVKLKTNGNPSHIQSFNYKSIKRLSYCNGMDQRLTIKVDFGEKEAKAPWWTNLEYVATEGVIESAVTKGTTRRNKANAAQ